MIEIINAHPARRVRKKPIESLVRIVVSKERVRLKELNVVFVDDRKIRRLNKKYLSHDRVTDVISFRLNGGGRIEGEVYVNLDQAGRQAREFKVEERSEVQRLVAHGVLHLIGYEDDTRRKRKIMQTREDQYIQWENR